MPIIEPVGLGGKPECYLKMIIPGVTEWPSQGRLLGDVIGWHINLHKGAQCSFYSLKWMNFTLPSDPPLLKLEYLKIHCL